MLKTIWIVARRLGMGVLVVIGFASILVVDRPRTTAPTVDRYRGGAHDIRGGRMPSGSVPCDVLPVELRAAIAARVTAGLRPEQVRGQVHEKYRIVMRECGMTVADIR
jgi:hypothetical protein